MIFLRRWIYIHIHSISSSFFSLKYKTYVDHLVSACSAHFCLTHTSTNKGVFCSVLSEGGAWSNACFFPSSIRQLCVIVDWHRREHALNAWCIWVFPLLFAPFRHLFEASQTRIYRHYQKASPMIQLSPSIASVNFQANFNQIQLSSSSCIRMNNTDMDCQGATIVSVWISPKVLFFLMDYLDSYGECTGCGIVIIIQFQCSKTQKTSSKISTGNYSFLCRH